MKKAIFFMCISLIFLISLSNESSAAAVHSRIVLDGQEITLPHDVQVTNINKNVMIPIRVVAENLKFKVNWDQKSQNVKIQQNLKTISLTVNQNEATVDNKQVSLNNAPQILNDTVVVPIRFVSEQMGLKVGWDNKDKIVYLTSSHISEYEESSEGITETNSSSLTRVQEIQFSNNQLIVSMDGQVTPLITTMKNPDRLIVDLPNTVFDDNVQPLGAGLNGRLDVTDYPSIADVRYSLFNREPGQVRIVIELLESVTSIQSNYEYIADKLIVDLSVNDENPDHTPSLPSEQIGRSVVVIDAGHGGKDPGTTSITNKHEKDFNLALALKVQALLLKEPEIEVIMTRETDVYPTRTERVQLANQLNADAFVSIHGNSVLASPQTTGTETLYYQRSSSKELADAVHQRLIIAMGLKDRGVKNNNFQVIRETKMAAVLLEVGFLSNREDEKAMLSDDVQDKAAQAIVDGIKEYLGIE